jgi:hypothetical protein
MAHWYHHLTLDQKIDLILKQQEFIMAGQVDLDAKLDELKASVSKELQQLADAVAASAPDLSPQVAKVQALIDALNADDPAAPTA